MTKTLNTKEHTDIKRLSSLERTLPTAAHPYLYLLRLDRPIGIWLLLLPSLWGIALSTNAIQNVSLHTLYIICLFSLGAIIMRGAGCVINDMWDRDLDKRVERTKNRPIASGQISVKQATLFLATLLLMGSTILLQFNKTTIILGCLTLPLIMTYPLMKRITWWPQLFLGLTFNFGALMGWTAINHHLAAPAISLYIGGIFWTIAYDTIYAHQDKEDDAMAGIKSTARLFGKNSKLWVTCFFIASLLSITYALYLSKGPSPSIVLILLPLLHTVWQIRTWNMDDNENSLMMFKSNIIWGSLITMICII